jgi:hypothetical protein
MCRAAPSRDNAPRAVEGLPTRVILDDAMLKFSHLPVAERNGASARPLRQNDPPRARRRVRVLPLRGRALHTHLFQPDFKPSVSKTERPLALVPMADLGEKE